MSRSPHRDKIAAWLRDFQLTQILSGASSTPPTISDSILTCSKALQIFVDEQLQVPLDLLTFGGRVVERLSENLGAQCVIAGSVGKHTTVGSEQPDFDLDVLVVMGTENKTPTAGIRDLLLQIFAAASGASGELNYVGLSSAVSNDERFCVELTCSTRDWNITWELIPVFALPSSPLIFWVPTGDGNWYQSLTGYELRMIGDFARTTRPGIQLVKYLWKSFDLPKVPSCSFEFLAFQMLYQSAGSTPHERWIERPEMLGVNCYRLLSAAHCAVNNNVPHLLNKKVGDERLWNLTAEEKTTIAEDLVKILCTLEQCLNGEFETTMFLAGRLHKGPSENLFACLDDKMQ
eukprot:CAMPEP_0174242610 /NCGR_PEP_ID=MMETSP0417-20130205/28534_1 /TAXON_ID=242541 /ORGANISM="Mayorella sp, Strain BSH-02190019" /LENGTH=346 /DNA_ID=CAMNT_0015322029 /DNA_START=55 /DNA_END=1092 /DNA_ORIENTATION=-